MTAADTAESSKPAAGGSASGTSPATSSGIHEVVDVVMHPLVLLSVADHYHRVARGTRKRVVGVLLGQVVKGSVDATNSFAVPFEEDTRNAGVFYFDHNYLEDMLHMYRKVNAKERVVGFYSSGPQLRPNDLRIYDIVQRSLPKNCTVPAVFCIIDIRPDRPDLPVTAYKVMHEIDLHKQDQQNQQVRRSFAHVPVQMGALEPEEVGVEHLLRDINDPTVSTLASLIKGKLAGLATLADKLRECQVYLESAARGEIAKVNPDIIANLQTVLNLLPNLNTEQLIRSILIQTNDMQLSIYLASLIRTVLALHDFINNKIRYGEDGTEYKQQEAEDEATAAEEKKDDSKDQSKQDDKKTDKDKKETKK